MGLNLGIESKNTITMEVYDTSLLPSGLYVHWFWPSQEGFGQIFPLEEVAAILAENGHTDGYTLKGGNVICLMDDRPGFPETCTVQRVWETLTGDQREAVAQKCIA